MEIKINLINHFKGDKVIVINREALEIQQLKVDLFLEVNVGQILAELDALRWLNGWVNFIKERA